MNKFSLSSFGNLIFNMRSGEWSRVRRAWVIRFFYKLGFFIGWTVIVTVFVSRFGVDSLPVLFILNALFTYLGTIVFSSFLQRYNKLFLMLSALFLAVFMLFVSVIMASYSEPLFLVCMLTAEAVFLVQFKILMEGLFEDFFTPSDCGRLFPVIESADTIAGIFAGFLVLSLADSIATYRFAFLWIVFLLVTVVLIVFASGDEKKKIRVSNKASLGIGRKIIHQFINSRGFPLVKALFFLVFLQWTLYALVEFTYTKAISDSIGILDTGSGFEHALVHDLGAFFMLFSSAALLFQLVLGGRIISSLGVVMSMLIHPMVLIIGASLLLFFSDFQFFVLLKNNFVITTVIFLNTYHSMYYAIAEKYRSYTRELMEGVVRPTGALFGSLLILFLGTFYSESILSIYITFLILFASALFFYVIYSQKANYSALAIYSLKKASKLEDRLMAFEILTQRGHKGHEKLMTEFLLSDSLDEDLLVRLLKLLSDNKNADLIPYLKDMLLVGSQRVRLAVLDLLYACRKDFRFLKKDLQFSLELSKILSVMLSSADFATEENKVQSILSELDVDNLQKLARIFNN